MNSSTPKIIFENPLKFIIAWNLVCLFPLLTAIIVGFIPDFGAYITSLFELREFWNFGSSR